MSRLFVIIAALYIGTLGARSAGSFVGADLIVFNATITTQSLAIPRASALAVKRGRIYAVGSDADILGLKDNNTRLIDAHGRRLIPGLMGAHAHIFNERDYNSQVKWEGAPTCTIAFT